MNVPYLDPNRLFSQTLCCFCSSPSGEESPLLLQGLSNLGGMPLSHSESILSVFPF